MSVLRPMGGRAPGPICEEPVLACIDEGTAALVCMSPPGVVYGSPVSGWSTVDRIGSAIRRSFARMPGQTAAKLASLLEPSALAILATTLLLWAGSHLLGIGEAIDILMIATGFIFVGWDAIKAVKHLVEFARLGVRGETEADLDSAGDHLAQAVAIIGVDVVLAFLTHRAVKAWKGRYKPSTTGDPNLPAGEGETTPDGDITYSTAGTEADRKLVLYHEQVHQFLTPKLQAFRKFRIDVGMSGYARSQLLQWLEESLAEAYAQLRVNGVKGLPSAFTFTIDNPNYNVTVSGVLIEAALYVGTIVVGGITLHVYLTPKKE